jgi:hypothetical protein
LAARTALLGYLGASFQQPTPARQILIIQKKSHKFSKIQHLNEFGVIF